MDAIANMVKEAEGDLMSEARPQTLADVVACLNRLEPYTPEQHREAADCVAHREDEWLAEGRKRHPQDDLMCKMYVLSAAIAARDAVLQPMMFKSVRTAQ